MHQHPIVADVVHVVAVDFEIVDGFGGGAVVDCDDFEGTRFGLNLVAWLKIAQLDPVIFFDRPDRVRWCAGDRLASCQRELNQIGCRQRDNSGGEDVTGALGDRRTGSDFADGGVGGDFEFGELHEDLSTWNRALLLPERTRTDHLDFDQGTVIASLRESTRAGDLELHTDNRWVFQRDNPV